MMKKSVTLLFISLPAIFFVLSLNFTYGITSERPAQAIANQNVAVKPVDNATQRNVISGVLLGSPTQDSVVLKVVVNQSVSLYYEYGKTSSHLNQKTQSVTYKAGDVAEAKITRLEADTLYTYHLMARVLGDTDYRVMQTGTFHTARSPGHPFIFTVQADSHRDENSNLNLYETTLNNVLKDRPDFHIDLGDTFMGEKLGGRTDGILQRYLDDRHYFEKIGFQVPLFLVNGNHEGEVGWDVKRDGGVLAKTALQDRLKYYVNPTSDGFYSASKIGQGNYYAYTWGDALFVTLDPFWFSQEKAQNNADGWHYTLGKTQYEWLKSTLMISKAKYKFIFIHNLVGGYGKDARGGVEAAEFYEWGGMNADGTYGFDVNRPGWEKPIHQLLVEAHVTAVFHGHDHFYAKQEKDGITYQLVPQPSHPGTEVRNAEAYSYITGKFLPPSGHLRITISKEKARVEYVGASLSVSNNGVIKDAYDLK